MGQVLLTTANIFSLLLSFTSLVLRPVCATRVTRGDLEPSANFPWRIFPTSLTGDVTSEIAEDDWERGWSFATLETRRELEPKETNRNSSLLSVNIKLSFCLLLFILFCWIHSTCSAALRHGPFSGYWTLRSNDATATRTLL